MDGVGHAVETQLISDPSGTYLVGHACGVQSFKMGMLFGVVNAFQWLTSLLSADSQDSFLTARSAS